MLRSWFLNIMLHSVEPGLLGKTVKIRPVGRGSAGAVGGAEEGWRG